MHIIKGRDTGTVKLDTRGAEKVNITLRSHRLNGRQGPLANK